jgi:arylsulfatase
VGQRGSNLKRWLRVIQTYIDFPPLQSPASYNLEQVMQQVREMKSGTD